MNPFISIWTQPKKTIQHVIDDKSIPYGFVLVALAALSTSLMVFADTGFLEGFSLGAIIAISILISLVVSIPAWGIMTAVYTWVGKLLGGTGTMRNMSLAIATTSIPMIWAAPLGILAVLLYGEALFREPSGVFSVTNMSIWFYTLNAVVTMGVSIFSLVIQSKGIGIVHQFSAWRGFGTIMIVVGVALVFLFVIGVGLVFSFSVLGNVSPVLF